MNLTLHLAVWDLRRLRPWLALWLGLVVLQAALLVSHIGLPGPWFPPDTGLPSEAREVLLALFTWLVAILKIGLLAVLVARLVHKDPTVGDSAFWLSRPVSRARLLAGKSLFLLLAVILPSLLVEAVLLLICGVTPQDTLRSVPQILLLTLLAVAPLMMLAAVTTNLARMSLLGFLVFLVPLPLGFLLLYLLTVRLQSHSLLPDLETGLLGAPLVLLATAVIVTGHQYLIRRTGVSIVLVFSGVAPALLLLGWWGLDRMMSQILAVDRRILDPARIEASIEEDSLSLAGATYRGPESIPTARPAENSVLLRGAIAVGPLPPDTTVLPQTVDARLRSPSGPVLAESYIWRSHRREDSSLIRLGSPIGQDKAAWLARLPLEVVRLFELDESQYEDFRGVPLVYTARVSFLLQRTEVAELLPARGFRLDRGSDRTEILSVGRPGGDALTIHLSQTVHRLEGEDKPESRHLLVNRPRGEALQGSSTGFSLSSPRLMSGLFPMLEVRRSTLHFRPPDGVEMDAAWIEGAELVRFETRDLGRFSKRVRMEGLVLDRVGPLPRAPSLGTDP